STASTYTLSLHDALPICLELIAQYGGQRKRDRRAAQHPEQRQIRGGDGLPQPLLAERPGPEPLDVGHMGMQDDRQLAAGPHRRRSEEHTSELQSLAYLVC